MNGMFFVPETRLAQLASTRSGRISYAGYSYQCGYAVAMLASMVSSKPLFGLQHHPKYLRYDWGEDLDEVLADDSICFTQCKRVDDIGQPARLAAVLSGFAPKWLWTPANVRDRIQFRLVSSDQRFQDPFDKEKTRPHVHEQFRKLFDGQSSAPSDRNVWLPDAVTVGVDRLFDGLWSALSFVYIDRNVVTGDPAGPLLSSEAAARDLLLKYGYATASTQKAAISDLRCLINESLIAFDPTNDECPNPPARTPIEIDIADVRLALANKKETRRSPQFGLVDRVVLSRARVQQKEKFLFQSPEWHHVVHGSDNEVRFVERDQTAALLEMAREWLVQPLLRGTSNLPILFVVGSPGAGKSTLVRRVAATLVQAGDVVVADAGLDLASGPDDLQSYAQDLQELASAGRPVLLVLDDPLFEESKWVDLLVHLKQPGFRVSAIAATPDFLYQRYRSQLSTLSSGDFHVNSPSPDEIRQFAEMYRRDISAFGASNDFLVMVAEFESGEPFSKLMERLWHTLNGGRPFADNLSFEQLPWEVRAFWIVCLMHRAYALCPLPNLKATLELSGGTGVSLNVESALMKLKAQSGWSIFRHHKPVQSLTSYNSDFISTAHQQIASTAWNQRPMQWLDTLVNRIIAQSTVVEPQSSRSVARAAGALAQSDQNREGSLANELMRHWQAAADTGQLKTIALCNLVAALRRTGGRDIVRPMRETLIARARGKDGWLAALQLWYMSSDEAEAGSFPDGIDLESLIVAADFAIAPKRAVRFIRRVGDQAQLVGAVYRRFFEGLEGNFDWPMDASLLGWFLEHVPTDDTGRCISLVVRRLERPDEDLALRSRYLTFLQRLPEEFREQRREAVDDITRWVSLHDNTPVVWAQYLAFLQGLPEEFDEQRKQAVADTPSWLERHGDAAILWMQFLAFLQSLPEEFDGHRRQAAIDIASWIARDDVEAGVVARNLTFVQSLPVECLEERKQAVAHTRTWLALHEDAPVVWVHYLTLLRGRPEEFDKQREQAAGDTEKWLERNDDAPAVWIEYLALVQGLSEEFREQRKRAVVATVGWLSRHDDEAGVWCQYLTFVQQLPAGFDDERIEAARAASDWLDRHPGSQEVRARYVLFILGVTDPALEPFQSASDIHHQWLIATNPGALNHRFNYGEQLRRLSRFDEAIAQYDIVLRQHKGHQMARRARGLSLQMLGRMPEAEAEFKHALWWARHGKHSQAIFHTTLGDFYLRSQRWQEAIRSFQRAQQEFPDHFANHRGIAKAHLELGNLGEAENAVKRALADPNLDLAARREIVQLYDALRLGQIP